MRIWIDSDVGDNPDDTIALWCARCAPEVDLAGVSTVAGDVERRAALARRLLPDTEVVAGPPTREQLARVDVLLGIGPWTNVARLVDLDALPLRVVLMGGALGAVEHRGAVARREHNVARDPEAAAHVLRTTGNLIVVPLDATAPIVVDTTEEAALCDAVPLLREQLEAWRTANGPLPLVLHDPAALLVALGERVARLESRRLRVEPDGTMLSSVDGPLQRVAAFVHVEQTRRRVVALASQGD